jgi:hypothetical protein
MALDRAIADDSGQMPEAVFSADPATQGLQRDAGV